MVGTRRLYDLALATSAAFIQTAHGGYIDIKTFWQRSVHSGVMDNHHRYC